MVLSKGERGDLNEGTAARENANPPGRLPAYLLLSTRNHCP